MFIIIVCSVMNNTLETQFWINHYMFFGALQIALFEYILLSTDSILFTK